MSHHDLPNEPERKVVQHEEERSEGNIHEHHVVREESFGQSEDVREREVTHREVVPPESVHEREVEREEIVRPEGRSRYSGEDRQEELHSYEDRWSFTVRVIRTMGIWIGVMLAVTEVFLGLRLLFGLTGANPAAGFVAFTYGSTGWMVAPFQGIGPNASTGIGVFEPATLVAMVVYPLIALLIIFFLRAIAASPRPEESYIHRSSKKRTL